MSSSNGLQRVTESTKGVRFQRLNAHGLPDAPCYILQHADRLISMDRTHH